MHASDRIYRYRAGYSPYQTANPEPTVVTQQTRYIEQPISTHARYTQQPGYIEQVQQPHTFHQPQTHTFTHQTHHQQKKEDEWIPMRGNVEPNHNTQQQGAWQTMGHTESTNTWNQEPSYSQHSTYTQQEHPEQHPHFDYGIHTEYKQYPKGIGGKVEKSMDQTKNWIKEKITPDNRTFYVDTNSHPVSNYRASYENVYRTNNRSEPLRDRETNTTTINREMLPRSEFKSLRPQDHEVKEEVHIYEQRKDNEVRWNETVRKEYVTKASKESMFNNDLPLDDKIALTAPGGFEDDKISSAGGMNEWVKKVLEPEAQKMNGEKPTREPFPDQKNLSVNNLKKDTL